MAIHHQALSALAWADDTHVTVNRAIYREKINLVVKTLATTWHMESPKAGFYLWPKTPIPDAEFAVRLIKLSNVKVLPGSYLSRPTSLGDPGTNRVRLALVATKSECLEAATRIADCWHKI